MKTSYTLTSEDIVEAKQFRSRRNVIVAASQDSRRRIVVLRRAGLVILCVGAILLFVSGIHLGLNVATPYLFFPLGVGVMLCGMLYGLAKYLSPNRTIAEFNKDVCNAGPYRLELTSEGVVHVTPRAQTEIEWSAIRNLQETKNLLLIVDDRPRMIPLPRRAFASVDEQQQFVDTVKAGLRSSFGR